MNDVLKVIIVHLSRPYTTFWMPTFQILAKSLYHATVCKISKSVHSVHNALYMYSSVTNGYATRKLQLYYQKFIDLVIKIQP